MSLVPGLAVIEGFDIPFREDEIFAVVFGVAIHAFLSWNRLDVVCSVQSLSQNDAGCDFVVTTQALEYRFAGRDFVATDAIGHSVDRQVRARKTGRERSALQPELRSTESSTQYTRELRISRERQPRARSE